MVICRAVATALATYRVGRAFDITFDLFASSNYWWQFFAGGNRPFQFGGPKKADLVLSYTRPVSDRWSAQFYTRVDNVLDRKSTRLNSSHRT